MERRNTRQTREIVVPGDVLDGTGMKPGDFAYFDKGKVRASVMGVRNVYQNTVGVIPLRGCYMPTSGDTVIGVIVDIGPSNWLVDIGAPYPAPLHVNEVPWKVEFGDTSRYLGMGNVVLLNGSMISMLKNMTDCRVTVGNNGMVWIDGDEENAEVAVQAIRMIEEKAQCGNLTDMIKEFIEKKLPQSEDVDDEGEE